MGTQELVNVNDPRVVFYPLRRGVLVTNEWFCAQRRRLAVGEIGDIGWRQTAGHLTRRAARTIVLTETGLVLLVGSIAAGFAGASIIAFGIAALYLAVVCLVTWLNAYRYPGPLQLWVKCHGGKRHLLFSSPDQTEFHKVRRALERAVEYHEDLIYERGSG